MLRRKLLRLTAIGMAMLAVCGIVAESFQEYHSNPPEGKPTVWLRGSVGNHQFWISWYPSNATRHKRDIDLDALGFRYFRDKKGDGFIAVRGASLVCVGVLGCALATWIAARPLRVPTGICPVCGYDLRFTPYECPECGCRIHTEVWAFDE